MENVKLSVFNEKINKDIVRKKLYKTHNNKVGYPVEYNEKDETVKIRTQDGIVVSEIEECERRTVESPTTDLTQLREILRETGELIEAQS